jgi:Cytochrome C oxidase, cbb3-type, subunit III
MHRASQTDQIREGAELFAVNCSPCHGPRMQGSESAFDLRKYPREQRDRFLNSVTRGKNQMPPWGDTFSPEQLDALWAHVVDRRAVNVRVAQTRAETARVIPSFPVLIIFVRYPPDERDACCPNQHDRCPGSAAHRPLGARPATPPRKA